MLTLLSLRRLSPTRLSFTVIKHDHVSITDIFICICTTMDWPSILATARDDVGNKVQTKLIATDVLLVLTVTSTLHQAACGMQMCALGISFSE